MHHIDCCPILELEPKLELMLVETYIEPLNRLFLECVKYFILVFDINDHCQSVYDDEKVNDKG